MGDATQVLSRYVFLLGVAWSVQQSPAPLQHGRVLASCSLFYILNAIRILSLFVIFGLFLFYYRIFNLIHKKYTR